MAVIRRNSDYALRSLVYMAKSGNGKRLTLDLIAKNEGVPVAFLRKIFQRLSKSGILDSRRGRSGGFLLLKSPSQISLKQIIESVQGKCALRDCLFEKNMCRRSLACGINKGLSSIQKKLNSLLENSVLQDFVHN